ncbi:MAG: hypothetical protein MJ181_05725 [Treponema sp.]|nr:hypothetical protein [Treponema sp.]
MENSEKEPFSLYEIIILACFLSLVFSPVGIVLMWLKKCLWKKKTKIIVSGAFGLFLAIAGALLVFLLSKPEAGSGSGNPFLGIEREYEGGGGSGGSSGKYNPKASSSRKNSEGKASNNTATPSKSFAETKGKKSIPLVLFLVLALGIAVLLRNLKEIKGKGNDNPYVNTRLIQTPIPEDFVFPPVHFSKLALKEGESLLFATPAEQKDNLGDIAITDFRFVFLGKKESYDFPLQTITAISSVSNTALLITEGENQHYFFVRDTQMRFVLQIVRWAYAHREKGNPEGDF